MTNDGNNTLVYDAENRVLSATNGGASGTYTYDGNSLRVKKVSGSTTTVYIFSGSKVIAEYDNGAAVGSPSREYIYSGATLLAKIDSSGTKYYHQDHLSNRVVTDSSGNTLEQLGHYPFGESWYNASNDKLLFTSYERDAESGNDYAMMRSYVNRLARFSSPDLLSGSTGNPQSLNHYSYTLNDPLNLADPFGLDGSLTCNGGMCYGQYDSVTVTADAGGSSATVADPTTLTSSGQVVMGGRGGGGGIDFTSLKARALVTLLTNPDCAGLFGGFMNAVTSLFSSTYDTYSPGDTNPYPGQIRDERWTNRTQSLRPTTYGFTFWSSARPGGNIFFTSTFNTLAPGFASNLDDITQMTGFFHEQEHAANQSKRVDDRIDAPGATLVDAQNINKNCTPKQIDTQSAPITGQLTPPRGDWL